MHYDYLYSNNVISAVTDLYVRKMIAKGSELCKIHILAVAKSLSSIQIQSFRGTFRYISWSCFYVLRPV
jgi:hypothetical protein